MSQDARSLWAWVTEEPGGDVSQIAIYHPQFGMSMTLVARNRAVIDILKDLAAVHRQRTKQRVWLREYRDCVDHEELP